jgi:hypothetical protein
MTQTCVALLTPFQALRMGSPPDIRGVVFLTDGIAAAERLRERAAELQRAAEEAQAAVAESSTPDINAAAGSLPGQESSGPGLGEVVWAREKGWPAWPALVVTFESTTDLANLSKRPLPCHHDNNALAPFLSASAVYAPVAPPEGRAARV